MARTSSRQAAQKAKEAISTTSETGGKVSAGAKRKAQEQKAPEPKKEKKEEQPEQPEKAEKAEKPQEPEQEKDKGRPQQPEKEPAEETEVDGTPEKIPKKEEAEEAPPATPAPTPQQGTQPEPSVESGVRKSEEREGKVPSNLLEKGIIYFFYRPRVNIEDPQGVEDVSRSFFVLRPIPLGAELDSGQGSMEKDARCRLMILPKKKFPTSGGERDMGFVEKANQSIKDLQEKFIAGSTYQTSTRGERHVEEARPYAEGVYAITSTRRASHLAYMLTIPSEIGEIQENFGLHERGSFLVQSKNPKFPGPSFAKLPKGPEYPES
jgi:type IV secretory pathway VirB10-like protein